jgi:apolipoprotein N-acyltransferase
LSARSKKRSASSEGEPEAKTESAAPAERTKVRRAKKDDARGPAAPDPAKAPAPKRGPTWAMFGVALLLAFLAGCLDFIAFPGFDVWPLAFVALVPLFFALDMQKEGQRFSNRAVWGICLLYGLVGNVGGFYWLIGTLERFSGFPYVVCLFFALVILTYQGGMLALFGWLWFRGTTRGWPSFLVAPLAFAAAELVWPLLFPYYHGNHLHEVPVLIQIADLGGPILVTTLVVSVNVAIYEVVKGLTNRSRTREHGDGPYRSTLTTWRRRVDWRGPLLGLAALLLTIGYGLYRIGEVDARVASSPEFTVGMVQTNMGILEKREDPEEGLQRHIDDSAELQAETELDLLVWPESAYNWLLPPDVDNVKPFVMGRVHGPLLFGGLQRRIGEDGRERFYNTAFLVDREGDILGTYDKTYLLMFGEYLPFGEAFPALYDISRHSGRFTPGDHVRPLELGDYRISALVCYEDIIPRFTREAVQEGDPHLLVNITNDSWFGDTTEPWEHLALAKFRAVEHHRYLVRSTNSGVSAVVDPVGRVVTQSGVYTREVLHARVHMMEGSTPYRTLGDWPGWLGLAGIVFLAFIRRPNTERRSKRPPPAQREGTGEG